MKDRGKNGNTAFDHPNGPLDAGETGVNTRESRSPEIPEEKSTATGSEEPQTLELIEETLSTTKIQRKSGEVVVRKVVDELPSDVEVEVCVERAQVEHIPVGREVNERVAPWHDGNTIVVPVYDEEVVITKRLILREEIRIRPEQETRCLPVHETIRRERVVVEKEPMSSIESAPRQH